MLKLLWVAWLAVLYLLVGAAIMVFSAWILVAMS